MGLLDALFQGSQGSGGGLLDFLRNNAMNQQMPGMLPSDTAQYGAPPAQMQPQMAYASNQPAPLFSPAVPQQNAQPSPLDTAQYPFAPMGAPSQANAQMPPQQPPPVIQAQPMQPAQAQPPQDSSPGIMDRLSGLARPGSIMGAIMGTPNPANLTVKALVAKGVDPVTAQAATANPELLKQLVDMHFGPQTKTSIGEGYVTDKNGNVTRAYTPDKSPISIGEGHIYNPATKKVEVAYEPADKIPAGFAKGDDGNMHFIPGGPADPAYLRLAEAQKKDPNGNFVLGRGGEVLKNHPDGTVSVVHKNEAGTDAPMLTPEGIDLAANRIINGEKGVTTGFARSKGDMAAVYNRVAELSKTRGLDASDILSNINNEYAAASASRSFGGMTAKQETYSNTAAKAIDIAEKASADVPRGTWVPVNKAILAWREKTGDPKVAALGQSLETLTQEYARAVGGGHGTVSDKEEAREYLAKAQTHDQLVARFNIMRQEIARGRESVGESAAHVGGIYRGNIRNGKIPEPGAEAPIAAPQGAPKAGNYIWMPGKGLVAK